jgi:hypothetical protein
MPASDAQRSAFGKFNKANDIANAYIQETIESTIRDWYRRGQAAFRKCLEIGGVPQIEQFNDLMQDMKEHQHTGFCMGWNSDAYAYANDMDFSIEGDTHAKFQVEESF